MAHLNVPCRRLALLAYLWLSACCARADTYLPKKSFEIPFALNPGPLPRKVILYASTDGKAYNQVAAVGPNAGRFDYLAARDGWHHFVVQTEDATGRREPPNILGVPALRICVDTVRPEVTLRESLMVEGRVAVEWEIKDENLDRRSLRLSYRPARGKWTELNPQLDKAHFHWKPNGPGPYEARLQVNDLAGNTSVKEVKLSVPAGAAGAARGPTTRLVHNRTFRLNYRVPEAERSGVKKIEVWMTRDKNSYWRLSPDAKPDQAFYEVTVPAQGRYGFTLLPVGGVGRCRKAPEVGQEPQVWAQVDETPPQAEDAAPASPASPIWPTLAVCAGMALTLGAGPAWRWARRRAR